MTEEFEFEAFEQNGPSYFPSYVMSGFVLVGVLSIASNQEPLSLTSGIFFGLWFGVFFVWMIRNSRDQRWFASDRLLIADGYFSHTFRYAVTEAEHARIEITDIHTIKVTDGVPISIELLGHKESDFCILPSEAKIDELVSALTRRNPNIKIVR
jgi:hypothetical protein